MQSICMNEWKVSRTKRGDGMGIHYERRQEHRAFSLDGSRPGGRFAAPTLTGESQIGWVTKDFRSRLSNAFFVSISFYTHQGTAVGPKTAQAIAPTSRERPRMLLSSRVLEAQFCKVRRQQLASGFAVTLTSHTMQ